MTPNQRQDMDRDLEMEQKWRPLNVRGPDSYDRFWGALGWVTGALIVIMWAVVIGVQVWMRWGR